MNVPAAIRERPWRLLEFALACLLLVWRCLAPTRHPVYLDVLFYLGLYWMLLLFVSRPDRVESLTTLFMLALLGIYLQGQMPHVLVLVDLLP